MGPCTLGSMVPPMCTPPPYAAYARPYATQALASSFDLPAWRPSFTMHDILGFSPPPPPPSALVCPDQGYGYAQHADPPEQDYAAMTAPAALPGYSARWRPVGLLPATAAADAGLHDTAAALRSDKKARLHSSESTASMLFI